MRYWIFVVLIALAPVAAGVFAEYSFSAIDPGTWESETRVMFMWWVFWVFTMASVMREVIR